MFWTVGGNLCFQKTCRYKKNILAPYRKDPDYYPEMTVLPANANQLIPLKTKLKTMGDSSASDLLPYAIGMPSWNI